MCGITSMFNVFCYPKEFENMLINSIINKLFFLYVSLSVPLLDFFYGNDSEVCTTSRQLLPCSPKTRARKNLKMGKMFHNDHHGGSFAPGPETQLISPQKSLSGNGLDWFMCLVANSSEVGVWKAGTEMSLYRPPVAPQVTQHGKWQTAPAYKIKYPCELLHIHNGTYLDSCPKSAICGRKFQFPPESM